MDNTTNITDQTNESNNHEQINLPKSARIKKKYLISAIFAATLVLAAAVGSFYFVRNLNLASTPNAPASEPAAAAKAPIKSWNGGKNCDQGCGANEYCENGRCRKSGGTGDARDPNEVQAGLGTQPVNTPTSAPTSSSGVGYEAIPGYRCSSANCNSGFKCINDNTCINIANPNLSVANDIENCGGTGKKCQNAGEACIGGQCVKPADYDCSSSTCDFGKGFKCLTASNGLEQCVLSSVSSVTPTPARPTVTVAPLLTTSNDSNNCGAMGTKCAVGVQKCEKGVCVATVAGAELCNGIVPDDILSPNDNVGGQARFRTCCVPEGVGIGVDPNSLNENGMLGVDYRRHWTNCAEGTTCVQGRGCFGSPTKTTERDVNPTATTVTITTTVTIPPTTTVTVTPTTTITPTATPSATVTVEPTVVDCNDRCTADDDCSDGLFCDTESNRCRKPECSTSSSCRCPTATPEPTPVGCNKRCTSDDGCTEGLFCDTESNRCRKPECSTSSSCRCPTARPTETDSPTRRVTRVASQPTILKEAGILDFPGAAVFGSGLLLTVIGILLAL